MPSTPIKASDERVIPFAPEQIWAVLADVTASPRWWPASVKLTVPSFDPAIVGSQVEILPRGGRPFRCRVEAIEPPCRMRMRYDNGFITGMGEWLLAAAGSGTRVSYEIDVQARGWLVVVLGKLLPLAGMHSRLMADILAGLEQETRKRTQAGHL